jgi:hypothetical protein
MMVLEAIVRHNAESSHLHIAEEIHLEGPCLVGERDVADLTCRALVPNGEVGRHCESSTRAQNDIYASTHRSA